MIDPLELHAYADGELDKQSEDRVRRQLQQCSASQAELDCIQNLKLAMKANCPPMECADAWKSCVGRLDELDKVKRTESFVGKYAWALCGVFLFFILAGGVISRMGTGRDMGGKDLARIAGSLGPVSRPTSREAQDKKRWLDQIMGQASQVISPDRIDVLGVATGSVDGHRVSQLALQDGRGPLTMLVVDAQLDLASIPESPDPRYRASNLQGVNCLVWAQGDYTLILAGERAYEELVQTAANVFVKS